MNLVLTLRAPKYEEKKTIHSVCFVYVLQSPRFLGQSDLGIGYFAERNLDKSIGYVQITFVSGKNNDHALAGLLASFLVG